MQDFKHGILYFISGMVNGLCCGFGCGIVIVYICGMVNGLCCGFGCGIVIVYIWEWKS